MCSRSLEISGVKFEVSALFPFLKIAFMFASFQHWGLDQSQLKIGRNHVLLVLGYLVFAI